MNLTALVFIGLIVYVIVVSLIIGFVHSATRKVRPNVNEHKKLEQMNKDNKIQKGEISNGNKER